MKAPHFFITGGTGLIGQALLPRLLRRFPDSTMTLLLRARDEADAGLRLRNIAVRLTAEGISDAATRIEGVRGDVAEPGCGLDPSAHTHLIARTTHIIHGAATIRFDHPLEEARAINREGTRSMLAMARKCSGNGHFERFVYIGSSSVSGMRSGPILEQELEAGQSFFNTYEQSKCESERLVRDEAGRIPVTIFRPSIVIGDSRTGRTSTFNVIYIPLRMIHKGLLPCIPGSPDTTLDLVPVDWVDDAMVALLEQPETAGGTYHITAGPQRAARLGDVVDEAIRYFDRHAPLAHPRGMEFISAAEFRRRLANLRGPRLALMTRLETLLPYVTVDRLFDSRNADALLERSGISFPRFAAYAGNILRYCLATNWGKQPETDAAPVATPHTPTRRVV